MGPEPDNGVNAVGRFSSLHACGEMVGTAQGRLCPPDIILHQRWSCPAKAGIQYAAASQRRTAASGILDHPLARVMTVFSVAKMSARLTLIDAYRGRSVLPIKNRSMDCAQRRPSRIAQTTSDWPRRMSPAENTFGSEVW